MEENFSNLNTAELRTKFLDEVPRTPTEEAVDEGADEIVVDVPPTEAAGPQPTTTKSQPRVVFLLSF